MTAGAIWMRTDSFKLQAMTGLGSEQKVSLPPLIAIGFCLSVSIVAVSREWEV